MTARTPLCSPDSPFCARAHASASRALELTPARQPGCPTDPQPVGAFPRDLDRIRTVNSFESSVSIVSNGRGVGSGVILTARRSARRDCSDAHAGWLRQDLALPVPRAARRRGSPQRPDKYPCKRNDADQAERFRNDSSAGSRKLGIERATPGRSSCVVVTPMTRMPAA